MRRAPATALTGLTVIILSACIQMAPTTPVPRATQTAVGTASAGATAATSASPSATADPSPTATAAPPLSLDLPDARDPRTVSVSIEPNVGAEGGEITVRVTSAADERIDELVLRWPTELGQTLFLAPFLPTPERIRDGGPPLVQPWTKWVIGPGEQGEPAGTISLGYGPLLPGATLEIPLVVQRRAPGPTAFDLQLLAGGDLLTLDDDDPAELRVEVP